MRAPADAVGGLVVRLAKAHHRPLGDAGRVFEEAIEPCWQTDTMASGMELLHFLRHLGKRHSTRGLWRRNGKLIAVQGRGATHPLLLQILHHRFGIGQHLDAGLKFGGRLLALVLLVNVKTIANQHHHEAHDQEKEHSLTSFHA